MSKSKVYDLKRKLLNNFIVMFIINFILFIVLIGYSKISMASLFIIMSITNIPMYFVANHLNLILLGKIDKILLFVIPFILAILFTKTNLYFNLVVYDLNTILVENMAKQDNGMYEVIENEIINKSHKVIFKWQYIKFIRNSIEYGTIEVNNNKVGYEIEVENNCIIKDINTDEYRIIQGTCN